MGAAHDVYGVGVFRARECVLVRDADRRRLFAMALGHWYFHAVPGVPIPLKVEFEIGWEELRRQDTDPKRESFKTYLAEFFIEQIATAVRRSPITFDFNPFDFLPEPPPG